MKVIITFKTIVLASTCLSLFMGVFGVDPVSRSLAATSQTMLSVGTPFTLPVEVDPVPEIPTPTEDIQLDQIYTDTEYIPTLFPTGLLPELETPLVEAVQLGITAFSLRDGGDDNKSLSIALRSLKFDGRIITLDLINGMSLGENQWGELLHMIDLQVSNSLYQISGLQGLNIEYYILIDGKPLEEMLPQSEILEGSESLLSNASQSINGIQGQKIVLSPGHGYYTRASGGWYLQNSNNYGTEDFINLDLVADLNRFVIASGGSSRPTRQVNKSAGNHSSGYAWWRMGASEYVRSLGAPETVWRPLPYSDTCVSGNCPAADHDIAARPEYANWIGANSMVSIHNNGGGAANCNSHGTETLYNTDNGYQVQSLALAQAIHGKLIQRIRERWDAGWCDRGVKGFNGSYYGENRRFHGPAVIVELAFMDVPSDNTALQNATFRAIAMAAINEGLVQYHGGVSCPTITGWKGEYWNNRSLNGYAVMCRNDSSVNFNWGTGGPGGSVLNDQFSARWTRTVTFNASNYRFHVRSDDGVRLWIDNTLVIDKWFDHGAAEYTVDRNLSAGDHSLKIEYYENGGGAIMQFWIDAPQVTYSYKLPWDKSQNSWYRIGLDGWHSDGYGNKNCLDFQPTFHSNANKDAWVLSMSSGTVTKIEKCEDTANLWIDHPEGEILYGHLDKDSLQVEKGDVVGLGTYLGDLYCEKNGSSCGGFADACGSGTGRHLHVALSDRDLTVDGHSGEWYADLDFGKTVKSSNSRNDDVSACPAPNIDSPDHGYISDSRTVKFEWDNVNCAHDGYTLRVKTVPDMSSGGKTVVDKEEDDTDKTITFDATWENQDLYWSVRAAGADEADWSPARLLIISTNKPPDISFDAANGQSFNNEIQTSERNWSFTGGVHDPEGDPVTIEFKCDDCDDDGRKVSQNNGVNWSHAREGMSGKNTVYFRACDNQTHCRNSRKLGLIIDFDAPTTQASLNGSVGPWPVWFTQPVAVQLTATDGATGNARVGVAEIWYRVDGGAWQKLNGNIATINVINDGQHTIEYYAKDNVGNTEATRSLTFQIDQTPPIMPSMALETHGAQSNVWQRSISAPTFTWDAVTDAGSGPEFIEFSFDQGVNTIASARILAEQPRTWTPQPAGVPTGAYILRGRARDVAGNWSAWVSLFDFKLDITPPENPSVVTHTAGITSTVWQSTTNTLDVFWAPPYDAGSGIKGCYVYWGQDPNGTGTTFITENHYSDLTPLCALNETCIGYLRLRCVDNVDNFATDWTTSFIQRYDGTPPTAALGFNGSITMTNQVLIRLDALCDDANGSECYAMRFSTDGLTWMDWETYLARRDWRIPPISRRWWPVYIQVRDGVGWASEIISNSIYLDTSLQQPRSQNYRLLDENQSSGAGAYTSTTYIGHGTLSQIADSAIVSSASYILNWGWEAGSQAIPLIVPGYDTYNFINGAFASGNSGTVMAGVISGTTTVSYTMIGVLGEIGLPAMTTTLTSAQFQHQPGFLAAEPSRPTWVYPPTPCTDPGCPPIPEPQPTCATPYLHINNGSGFTNQLTVTLNLCASRAISMMVSSDISFTNATWEPYAITRTWTLPSATPSVTPQIVYAAFQTDQGQIYKAYFDSVVYVTGAPSVTLQLDTTPLLTRATSRAANAGVPIYITVRNARTPIVAVEFSDNITFTGAIRIPYAPIVWYMPPSGEDGEYTVYGRVYDQAGNVSATTPITFIYDVHGPEGGGAFGMWAVRPDTLTATVYLGAGDSVAEVTGMRWSFESTLTSAAWHPYTDVLGVPLEIISQTEVIFYVQYRDANGNESEIYSDTLHIDAEPPVVYLDVSAGNTLTRLLTVHVFDNLSDVAAVYLSNDPLMETGVLTITDAFTTTTWGFNDNRIVWARAVDTLGNLSEPYPAYAPEAVFTVSGPDTGIIDTTYLFTASTNLAATTTFTYVWQTDSSAYTPTVVHSHTSALDIAAFSWLLPGLKTVSVNVSTESETYTVTSNIVITSTVCPAPVTNASIVGPTDITSSLYIGELYTFHSIITPTDATPPITYTWTPTPTNGQGPIALYRWDTPGTYPIMLTVENCGGGITTRLDITVYRQGANYIYLPLVLRNAP